MTKEKFPEYRAEKAGEGFWVIEQNGVRCFLFEGDDMALLVDAGFGGDLKTVCQSLTDKPVQLILTHADGDHIGAAWQFGPVMMHPAEFSYYQMRHGKLPDTIPVWEGETIDLGRYCFEIVLISGHTPGSIALLERNHRFIITGDTVGNVPVYMFGNGRNLSAYLASIRKLKGMKDSFDVIFASHGKMDIKPDFLTDLCLLAGEICHGRWPQPQPAPAHMPDTVKIYTKYGVAFYLEK